MGVVLKLHDGVDSHPPRGVTSILAQILDNWPSEAATEEPLGNGRCLYFLLQKEDEHILTVKILFFGLHVCYCRTYMPY